MDALERQGQQIRETESLMRRDNFATLAMRLEGGLGYIFVRETSHWSTVASEVYIAKQGGL